MRRCPLKRFVLRDGTADDPHNYWWNGYVWSPNREAAALFAETAIEAVAAIQREISNADHFHIEPWEPENDTAANQAAASR